MLKIVLLAITLNQLYELEYYSFLEHKGSALSGINMILLCVNLLGGIVGPELAIG